MMKTMLIAIIAVGLGLAACGGQATPEERIAKLRELTDAKKFDKARDILATLMVDKPTDPNVLSLGSKIFIGLAQFDSAQAYAKKYSSLYSEDAEGYRVLFEVSNELEDYSQQLWAISQLGYLEHDKHRYLPIIAELNLKIGNPHTATTVCLEFLKREPDNVSVRFMLARGLMASDKADSAIAVLEGLDRQMPNQMEILANLASYYAAVKKYNKAEERFGQLTILFPEFTPAWFGLGNVQTARGDTAGAIESYRHVTEVDSTFLGVDTLLQKLGGGKN